MKRYLYFLIILPFLATSCKKILDVKTPPNALSPLVVFSDSVNLKSAVLGLYSGLNSSQSYVYMVTVLNTLYADETTSTSNPAYLASALSASDAPASTIWLEHYASIYRANAMIEGLQTSSVLTATTKQQAMGEAHFVRAFCHFMLLNIYGNIPLITSTNVTDNARAPQATPEAVYQQIISDLKEAIADLPANYSVSGNERTRANKLVATALLAKVYLTKKDWVNAETQAGIIVNNPLFNLPNDLGKVFLNTSTEAIFQLDNRATGYVPFTGFFVPTAGVVPGYILRMELLNSFEPGDLRKTNWVGASAGYAYPAKYKITRSGTGTLEYGTILRLADLYLVHAEACAQQDKIDEAQKDINAVRQRAGLGKTQANDQVSLLLAIEKERRVEMFCEYGSRFFDLKRTGRIDAVLSPLKPAWKSTAANYPIPSAEISKNPNLIPNPGY